MTFPFLSWEVVVVGLALGLLVASAIDPEAVAHALSRLVEAIGTLPHLAMSKLATGCRQLVGKMVGGDAAADTPGVWQAGEIILTRLLWLAVATAVIGGGASLEFLRGALVALGVPSDVQLVPAPVAIGLLVVATPVLWSEMLFEALGVTSHHTRLFPQLSGNRWGRVCLGLVALVCAGLSLLLGLLLWVVSYWQLARVDPNQLLGYELLVNGLLGALVALASFFVGKALVYGLVGLLAVPVIGLWLLTALLEVITGWFAHLMEFLATDLLPRIIAALALPGQLLWNLLLWLLTIPARLAAWIAQQAQALRRRSEPDWPEQGRAVALAGAEDDGVEDEMVRGFVARPRPPQVSLLFVDLPGYQMAPTLLTEVQRLGGKGWVAQVGQCPVTQHPRQSLARWAKRFGAVEVRLSPQEVEWTRRNAPDAQGAYQRLLLRRFFDTVVSCMPKNAGANLLLVIMDIRHVPAAAEALQITARALPRQRIALVTQIPLAERASDPEVAAGLRAVEDLWANKTILAALPIDPQSPLGRLGQSRWRALVAHTLAGLVMAHGQNAERNLPPAEVWARASREQPWLALAVDSGRLESGGRFSWGRGDSENMRETLRRLIDTLPWRQETRVADVPVMPERANQVVLYRLPLRPTDPRAVALAEAVDSHVGGALPPGALALPMLANGAADGRGPGGRFFAEVARLSGVSAAELAGAPKESDPQDDTGDSVRAATTRSAGVATSRRRKRLRVSADAAAAV
jgi:hypothetical protein